MSESQLANSSNAFKGLVGWQRRSLVGVGKPPGQNEIKGVRSFFFKVGTKLISVRGRQEESVLEVAHNHKL